MYDAFLSLSPQFQRKAAEAYIISYKSVDVEIIFQKPDKTDLVERIEFPVLDQVETGLDAIVLARVGAENPEFMPYLEPHIRKLNGDHILDAPANIATGKKFDFTSADSYMSGIQPDRLRQKTDRLLNEAMQRLANFPVHLSIDFRKISNRQGHLVPTPLDHAAHFAGVCHSPIGQLRETTKVFAAWVQDSDMALNLTTVEVNPIHDAVRLEDAKQEAYRHLRALFSPFQPSNILQ